jgi:predicted DNA-binding transcriptional regulator
MPNILEYYLQISLSDGLIAVCTLHCSRTFSVFCANSGKVIQSILSFFKSGIIQANYTLQNWVHYQKQSQQSPEVPKSLSNIIKSPKKEEKAVEKHSLHLHFQAFSGFFLLCSILNSGL